MYELLIFLLLFMEIRGELSIYKGFVSHRPRCRISLDFLRVAQGSAAVFDPLNPSLTTRFSLRISMVLAVHVHSPCKLTACSALFLLFDSGKVFGVGSWVDIC